MMETVSEFYIRYTIGIIALLKYMQSIFRVLINSVFTPRRHETGTTSYEMCNSVNCVMRMYRRLLNALEDTSMCREIRSCSGTSGTLNSYSDMNETITSYSKVNCKHTKDHHTYFPKKYWANSKVWTGTLFRFLLLIFIIMNNYTLKDTTYFRRPNSNLSVYSLFFNKPSCAENKNYHSVSHMTRDLQIVLGLHRSSLPKNCSSNLNCEFEIQLFPASLNPYFDEVKSDRIMSVEEIMKYEWNRFGSFRTFPTESPVCAIHLARAGFYYDGHRDDVVCFSCGTRHSNWRRGDSPMDVHRQISPNCRFINGDDLRNVPISNVTTGPDSNRHETSLSNHNSSSQGASALTDSSGNDKIVANCNFGFSQANLGMDNNRNTESRGQSACNAESNERIIQTVGNDDGSLLYHSGKHYGAANRSEATRNAGYTQQSLDSTFGKPMHPRYAVLAIRISSFAGWPVYSRITPRNLAQAGLFYAGFGDSVRCFFCGGGLRNWEPRDDPWVEHARWFPRCHFVIQSQGDEFVHAVQRQVLEQQFGNMLIHQDITQPEAGLDEVSLPLNFVADHNADSNPNNSAAAESAFEMGYSIDTVRNAIRQMRRLRGANVLHAEQLLNFMLENEESEAELVSTCAHGNQRKNSTHRHDEDDDSKKEQDNGLASNTNERTLSLIQENRKLKEQGLCKVCLKEPCCIVLLPCSHMVTCPQCAPALRKCPVCGKMIKGTVRAYIS